MKGIIITNGFVVWDKFETIYSMLIEAFERQGAQLVRMANYDFAQPLSRELPTADFVLFWDKDINLARRLELNGFRVYNSAKALEWCDDKSLTAVAAAAKGITMPETVIAPKTFSGYNDLSFLDNAEKSLGYPLILKECFGSFGNQVWLIENREMLEDRVMKITPRPMIFEKYIDTSYGKDLRIHVVGGKVVAAVQRRAKEGDFRANVTNGGKMYPVELNDMQIETAIAAAEALNVDFAGVDLLFGENDRPVLCEINTNAHFKNLYDVTHINVADYIAEYVVNDIKRHI